MFEIGKLFLEIGNLSEALTFLSHALGLNTYNPDYCSAFADVLELTGSNEDSKMFRKQSQSLREVGVEDSIFLDQTMTVEQAIFRAQKHLKSGCYDEANELYTTTLQTASNHMGAVLVLALIAQGINRHDIAIQHFRHAIEIDGSQAVPHYHLGYSLNQLGHDDDAVSAFQHAVTIDPKNAQYLKELGAVFESKGQIDKAVSCYEKALSINPGYAEAYHHLANIQIEQSQFYEAEESCSKAIMSKPDFPEAYYTLSRIKKFTDLSEINILQAMLDKGKTLKGNMLLNFSLGNAFVDLKQYSESITYYLEGNRLKRSVLRFDINNEVKSSKIFLKMFVPTFFKEKESFGCEEYAPIFVIGMPHSGSVLVEQILSNQPDVYGVKELAVLEQLIFQKMSSKRLGMIPYTVSRLKAEELTKLGAEYLAKIRKTTSNKTFKTNKIFSQIMYIGIVKLLFPNAKIIYTSRPCEETCLSIFHEIFTCAYSYAYDMTELGQYYQYYSEVMTSWHQALPEMICDINYEKLSTGQLTLNILFDGEMPKFEHA
jgi:tetratricopeptide (TPR) repeat protein